MNIDINEWKANFVKAGIKPEIIEIYISYISRLSKTKSPIIFDFNHLCLLLGRSPRYLSSVVNSNASHYREFTIPKRSKGHRTILAPYPSLLHCQYWIYNNILKYINIHPSAQGFTFKKSIITNAKIHLNEEEFLKIDIKDFFPSIKINHVISIFKSLGYTHRVSFYLAAICCYKNELPQGAPTSPILSNIVAKLLDKRLYRLAKKFNLKYSRYADDLAFSGFAIPIKFIEYVDYIIRDENFEVNKEKTFLSRTKDKRILTGISIASQNLSIPRDYKRELKKEIHFIRKYSLSSHIRKMKIKNPHYLQTTIGKVRFWLSVEPQNGYAQEALSYLSKISD